MSAAEDSDRHRAAAGSRQGGCCNRLNHTSISHRTNLYDGYPFPNVRNSDQIVGFFDSNGD